PGNAGSMFRADDVSWSVAAPVESGEDMAEWNKREFSKGQIDRAGLFLAEWWRRVGVESDPEVDREQLRHAWHVAQNWRTCHTYPLNAFQVNLRARAKRVEDGALIAQRLKRMWSVLNKLEREEDMKLSQMHDLGGCRAIMSDVAAVDKLFSLYRG